MEVDFMADLMPLALESVSKYVGKLPNIYSFLLFQEDMLDNVQNVLSIGSPLQAER